MILSALGYLHVNTGNYQKALELFSSLLQQNPNILAAYLGRGTAYALVNQIDAVKKRKFYFFQIASINFFLLKAIKDFTSAIQINSNCTDAWKRRGQVNI